ncbi:Lrp/AsnC family transcriptional regulator [Microcella alkalica]|uniref:Lrp/AsnC family transcriptional regulator n=1 Tax=Microcella alkalica TaxID=355930 RepID=UPI00145CE404|nr:Lrp/AsnC family transcriptional regulator [Microcella alkalica]
MDAIDSRIIEQLRQNARAGYGDIGDVVGLSASAVKRRVDKLVADRVIRGFTVQVDPAVEGLAVEAYVELFCRGTVAPDELRRILLAVPEVVEAGTVTGDADAIVRLRSRDIPSMEEALERVRSAPNVDHTRSAIVFSRLVDRTHE